MAAIDWGSVPTWFSAIGTTGSLIATLTIVLRDRRKDEREDAACLAVWWGKGEQGADELRIHNAAGRPVFDLVAYGWVTPAFDDQELRPRKFKKDLVVVVAAGAEVSMPVPMRGDVEWVTFRDAHQVVWRYDLESKVLTRERKQRLLRSGRDAGSWTRRQSARIVRAWRRRRSGGGEAEPEQAS
ncbi:hypothetical protein ACWDTQ_31030 [Streptomyces cellulosae]